MKVYTVGTLKEIIQDLPDDMKIVKYTEGMEQRGYLEGAFARVEQRIPVKHDTYDRFDYTEYSYQSYERSPDGFDVLVIE
jgi:hypothetical protein